MIISRTPFRISFAGGGTDLPSYYLKGDGRVINTTIDKYIYVAVKRQTAIAEHKFRINWSKVEFKDNVDDIEHPIVREALKMMKIDFPLEISTFADIPAQTGLGSSSAFAVGLLHALHALKGEMVTKGTLATEASQLEIDILGRKIGKQDHYSAAYGNLNVFEFHKNGQVSLDPVFYRAETKAAIEKHLLLFYTSIKRDANEILKVQSENTPQNYEILSEMKKQVAAIKEILSTGKNLHEFGRILDQGWKLKKNLASAITSSGIDQFYERAISAGAIGGKLLGAGGGGFLLFYVEPQNQQAVKNSLSNLYELPFSFDTGGGTRITYYDQERV
ncbi:MAG: GHMP kinase [Nitrospina sp.]|mgnify:CR=1 FL=1|jgi:D-glycero-alpha-D-manno-heptose-7-phosphate kinase|nr:GHMP kinase [Nitrospina sp.]MBT7196807.1 GHMP kinase [Nitrospina sp.]